MAVNTDRIVPVSKIDLISLYAVIFAVANVTVDKLTATNPGEFSVTSATNALLATEPVKTLDIASTVTSATIYFTVAHDFTGFTIGGETTEIAEVETGTGTLYKAVLADGAVTVTAV